LKLKQLHEGKAERAAVDFLSQLIRKSPYKGKVYLAGGYVRDELLGSEPKDIDLVVELPDGGIKFAEWVTKKLGIYKRGSNPVIYPKFGTAKFEFKGQEHKGESLDGIDIEVVMTRSEEYTRGSRKPDVKPGTLKQDVERRDFTVNSLLKDLTTGEIKDLTGQGRTDLKKGVVRTPLNPDVIFSEDPLRMLRAIRFTSKYGWDLPLFMIKAIKKNAMKIGSISSERVRDELDKMLVTKRPKQAIRLMKVTGLLKHVMPELNDLSGVTQNKHHDQNAFDHSMTVLEKVPPVLTKRLGALMHDIGKKATRSVVDSEVHFYRHEEVGAEIAKAIMKRLRYPNDVIDKVAKSIENHMRLKTAGPEGQDISDKALRKLQRQMGDHLEDTLDIMDADNRSHAKDSKMDNQITGIRKRLGGLNLPKGDDKIALPIDGKDLIEMGFKPGPEFKKILARIQDEVDENPELTKAQAIEIVNNKFVKVEMKLTNLR